LDQAQDWHLDSITRKHALIGQLSFPTANATAILRWNSRVVSLELAMNLVKPKSAETLAAALERSSFDGRVLSGETIKSFVETIKYNKGNVAHMEYAEVKDSLSEKGFLQFLDLLGIAVETFERNSAKDCVGDSMYRHCVDGPHYCDPSQCHGN